MKLITKKTAGKMQTFLVISKRDISRLEKFARFDDDDLPKSETPEEREAREQQEALEIEGPELSPDQELEADFSHLEEDVPDLATDIDEDPLAETSAEPMSADEYMDWLIDLQQVIKGKSNDLPEGVVEFARENLSLPPTAPIPRERLPEVMQLLIEAFKSAKKAFRETASGGF